MSDNIKVLAKRYEENVSFEHPRSIGLFTIPEYPEYEPERGMWSAILETILTTLRYLAPATLLTLFWGQQSFLFKILKHIDSSFRAIVFSSEEQKQAVLQWLAEAGSAKIEHLDTVWRQGWILCRVLDAALPGACAGHPPTRLSLKHAQAIADHYLGVEPVFSRQELESNDSLCKHQEWKLANYLDRIRQALTKLTPPFSKPSSHQPRSCAETTQFSIDYVAKGSGLSAAQVENKAIFKIYPTAHQALDPGEITILIRGPKDTYGLTVLPPIFGKAQMLRNNLLGLQSKQNFTENILPITQGATYLRSYGKNDMNKTYYIPKTKYDIEIEAESHQDHVKICYVVNLKGNYEVSVTSRGQNIVGSPFIVKASDNIIRILEKENCCLENGEEINIVDVKTDRKVVLRIVDFVTEKMLLKENGALERISDDEAKLLMSTEKLNKNLSSDSELFTNIATDRDHRKLKGKKFNDVAHQILKMNRVCKILHDNMVEKQNQSIKKGNSYRHPRSQRHVPDIVNSTFSDTNMNPFMNSDNKDKYIVPESLSVSIRTEKSKAFYEEKISNDIIEVDKTASNIQKKSSRPSSPDSLEKVYKEQIEDDNSVGRITPLSINNPFLTDVCDENYITEKSLGTFVTVEYETNNSQNEETQENSIQILVERNIIPSPNNNNPFIDTSIMELDRPKTPVHKIIAGEIVNRDGSVYVNPKSELIPEEMLSTEFVNPFFMHHHQSNPQYEQPPIADFIIGAPVSLPPVLRATSPEPESSLKNTRNVSLQTNKTKNSPKEKENKDISTLIYLNSVPINVTQEKYTDKIDNSSFTFHSFESNLTENNSNPSTSSDNQLRPYQIEELQSNGELTHRKDLWDSAYVSIDDNNSSPDSNNNENTILYESFSKQRFSPSGDICGLKREDICNMGPAEREIWKTCSELNDTTKTLEDNMKPQKWDMKRPNFTPIIEESISSGMKDLTRSERITKQNRTDPVTEAFAELNDMFHEYFPNSESSSNHAATEDSKLQNIGVEYTIDTDEMSVDSASDLLSDVMRHETEIEGTISEVQANVTESVSVSQILQDKNNEGFYPYNNQKNDETQFGDRKGSNIVLERKKYWDDKIRQIEAKTEESTTYQKKRRTSSKQLKHNDSLSKRRGKQIVKKIFNAGTLYNQIKNTKQIINPEITSQVPINHTSAEPVKPDENIVEKWKKYWDDKLELENDDSDKYLIRTNSPKNIDYKTSTPLRYPINSHDSILKTPMPVKQELPEEVFKAFETSPKRFFGTSRKHILNKIDTFLGNPSTADNLSPETNCVIPDTGLVSSRISLFHNMTSTEPWTRRKCQSLQNIYQRKSGDKIALVEGGLLEYQEKSVSNIQTEMLKPDETILNESEKASTGENGPVTLSLKDKRARMVQQKYKSFDETDYQKLTKEHKNNDNSKPYVKMTVDDINEQSSLIEKYKKNDILRRTSISKSEMDIFNKIPSQLDDSLDKHRSCDELPKINVKSFISLYESVSKTAVEAKPVRRMYRTSSIDSQKQMQTISITKDAENELDSQRHKTVKDGRVCNNETTEVTYSTTKRLDAKSIYENADNDSIDIEIIPKENETTYLSLSDIELEIVENTPQNFQRESSTESSPEHINYKNRFKLAKQYFQSLEELREIKKPRKLNECQLLLLNKSNESLNSDQPQKRVKKKTKSHSMPSSELSKIWDQMPENQKQQGSEIKSTKLIKISEKFNVDDLFSDVMEGKLSRQGSLRGIPHKKAVLETFRSMENISDAKISPYEFATSQLSDFAKENRVKHAQTYLTEYPYLPTTDPSRYHSRLDTKASGLISFKELLENKGRRNSVPDLRLNPKFTADL